MTGGTGFDLRRIREAVAVGRVAWSRHGVVRMQERGIERGDVIEALNGGEVIESYPGDLPYPSALILGFARGRPLHVVVAIDTRTPEAHIITVYEPSPDEFETDWRTRRRR
ncbi:MAG TPA: DUF4258 domain-containing protein [Candidatus Acidoferrum sp.]|nr:DUF4258 domain-containing protein [Candidatus Acidoferrum sp.]